MNIIPLGGWAYAELRAQDASNVNRNLATLVAQVSDYTKAYIVKVNSTTVGVVPKVLPGPGVTWDPFVTVTLSGTSLDGTAVTPTVVTFSIIGPTPVDPQATKIVVVGITSTSVAPPADPGSDTVVLI